MAKLGQPKVGCQQAFFGLPALRVSLRQFEVALRSKQSVVGQPALKQDLVRMLEEIWRCLGQVEMTRSHRQLRRTPHSALGS